MFSGTHAQAFYKRKARSEIRTRVLDDVKHEGNLTYRAIGVKYRSILQLRVIRRTLGTGRYFGIFVFDCSINGIFRLDFGQTSSSFVSHFELLSLVWRGFFFFFSASPPLNILQPGERFVCGPYHYFLATAVHAVKLWSPAFCGFRIIRSTPKAVLSFVCIRNHTWPGYKMSKTKSQPPKAKAPHIST